MRHRTCIANVLLPVFAALLLAACGSDRDVPAPEAPTAGPDAQDMETRTEEPAASAMPEPDDATAETRQAAAANEDSDEDGDPCTLTIRVGDNIAYSTNAMSVPSSCTDVSVTIVHTGNLPATAMGHNWVLIPAGSIESVAMAGMNAGADAKYVPADDDRIIAATDVVGGGESDTVTFSLSDLAEGTDYVYICTFPGHWSIMQGTFAVTD
jgi:azurin